MTDLFFGSGVCFFGLILLSDVDPFSVSGSGWAGAGLLGAVLGWLLLKHLPDKDKQEKEIRENHAIIEKQQRESYLQALKEERTEYKETLNDIRKSFETTLEVFKIK